MSGWEDKIWEDPSAHQRAIENGLTPAPSEWARPESPSATGPRAHVFVDDSGCSGFKFDAGSSTYAIMSAVVFDAPSEIEKLAVLAGKCKAHNQVKTEWKYSGTREDAKDCFFRCTDPVKYRVRAMVVDKRQIFSHKLLERKPLKAWMIRQLLTHTFGTVSGAKVIVDGQDTKGFGIEDQSYLLRKVNLETPGVVHSVKFDDSKASVGIQLADMTAGAIARAYEPTKRQSNKHLQAVRPRTFIKNNGNLWYFRKPL